MLQILKQEIHTGLGLVGAQCLAQIDVDMVNTSRLQRDLIGSVKL